MFFKVQDADEETISPMEEWDSVTIGRSLTKDGEIPRRSAGPIYWDSVAPVPTYSDSTDAILIYWDSAAIVLAYSDSLGAMPV